MQGNKILLQEKASHGTRIFPLQIYSVDKEQLEINNRKHQQSKPPFPYSALPLHFHREFEIICIKKGDFLFDIGGQKIKTRPGDILNINSAQLHSAVAASLDSLYISVVFDMRLLASNNLNDTIQRNYILPLQNGDLYLINHVTDPHILQPTNILLDEFFQVMSARKPGYELAARGLLSQYIACFFAQSCVVDAQKTESPLKLKNSEAIRTALSFIEDNYSQKITVDDLAKELNYSRYTCCRFFKENFGTTFVDYLNNYRITMAHQLLQKNTYTITQISSIVGFSSPSYFSKIYKNYTGNAPSQTQHIQIDNEDR